MSYQTQHQLTDGMLLNERGELQQSGYDTHLSRLYDRSQIKAGCFRIKEWDYYCISSPDTVLALTIADNSYMGLESVTLIDIPMRWQHTKTFMRAFPMGKTGLPSTSEIGDVEVSRSAYSLRFQNDGKTRILTVHVDNFFDGKPLNASIALTDAPKDSMVIATPFVGNHTAFYYNQKINCLRAKGELLFDDVKHMFTVVDSMAVLDWGRGVWTYSNTWYWSSASGLVDGVPFGMNLGYGFGDTTAATENMLFYNGIAHKLEHVIFEIPTKEDASVDFLKPWHMTSNDGRLELMFTPLLDRASLTSAIVIQSNQHQVFGYFSGIVILDGGEKLTIDNLFGFAEKVCNKW